MSLRGSKATAAIQRNSEIDILIFNKYHLKMTRQYYVYILFNKRNGTLYTGVTSDLIKRVFQHKNKFADGFTKLYDVNKLGYYEIFEDIEQAILREKQIKAGSRKKKLGLIESINPEWIDLYNKII